MRNESEIRWRLDYARRKQAATDKEREELRAAGQPAGPDCRARLDSLANDYLFWDEEIRLLSWVLGDDAPK